MAIPIDLQQQLDSALNSCTTEAERAKLFYDLLTELYDKVKAGTPPNRHGLAADTDELAALGSLRDAAGKHWLELNA